jgi:peptide/nickel transport system permease protein
MFIVPGLILGTYLAASTMRMTRTMMLEVLRQDYIRTAWAKGLRERLVVLRHGLKNALIPVVTYVGLWLPVLIGGTVIIERIFALQGMGYLIVDATEFRDYPIMSGVMLLFGLGMVIINLLVDITYGFLQPRVQHT